MPDLAVHEKDVILVSIAFGFLFGILIGQVNLLKNLVQEIKDDLNNKKEGK